MPKSKSEAERLAPQDADGKEQPVGALACPADEAERHLRAFIAAFVLPDARPRWLEMLIDRRSEWDSPLPKSHPNPRHLKMMHRVWNTFSLSAVDPRYRRKIPSGQRVAAVFEAEVGKGYGVYICPGTAPCRMSAVQASELLYQDDGNALLSFRAGEQVLFFAHSDGVWLCHKP